MGPGRVEAVRRWANTNPNRHIPRQRPDKGRKDTRWGGGDRKGRTAPKRSGERRQREAGTCGRYRTESES